MSKPRFLPLNWTPVPEPEMAARAREFRDMVSRRRTVRQFADLPVAEEVVRECILAAATAPSGANRQPWRFVAVSDPRIKRRIREAAEAEEREFYEKRAPDDWLEALAPLGTDAEKPFLETAPWLIAVFAESYGIAEDGTHRKNYYVQESVGIATGILITALHASGLATLTHTPSPMRFLNSILDRPDRERPFLLLVVGFPAEGAMVPDIRRKSFDEIARVV